ncbi:MAG TPA: hypothetical protein VMC48_05270 [Methanobacterium sp.]|nr:hypothetical protein [Methanobacterium sp.]
MDDKRKRNRKLINISYVGSVLAYVVGLYFITLGYLWAFIGTIPTLIFGLNLIKDGETRYGLILVIFFFVWIIIYYSYLPGHSLNQ